LFTILQIFLIGENNNINPKKLKFLFGSEDEKQEHELDKENKITLLP
jgi:hypothetical protein